MNDSIKFEVDELHIRIIDAMNDIKNRKIAILLRDVNIDRKILIEEAHIYKAMADGLSKNIKKLKSRLIRFYFSEGVMKLNNGKSVSSHDEVFDRIMDYAEKKVAEIMEEEK